MHWMWGYLATGAVVVGMMIWHADSTRRRFEKRTEGHLEAARRAQERNWRETRTRDRPEAPLVDEPVFDREAA